MRARIYKPAKTAMQSGTAKTHRWVLDFPAATRKDVDPLMGWTSSPDTQSQVRLTFESKQAALDYATAHGIDAMVVEPKDRKPVIRPRGYGENFVPNRRSAWTH